jgi:hypothetical protein
MTDNLLDFKVVMCGFQIYVLAESKEQALEFAVGVMLDNFLTMPQGWLADVIILLDHQKRARLRGKPVIIAP